MLINLQKQKDPRPDRINYLKNTKMEANQQETIKFFDEKKENGLFSNFYSSKIKIDGEEYKTVEHYFQAMKFEHEPEYKELIKSANTPMIAKIYGSQKCRFNYPWAKKIKENLEKFKDVKIREDWDSVRDEIMFKGLSEKFKDSKLREKLLETGTASLEEHNPNDNYWGLGRNKDGKWTGLNKLGSQLMILREQIRNE